MADVIKKVVQIDTAKSPSTVKELKTQISQLRDALVGLDTTSDEYKIVVEQLSSAQQTLTTVMNAGKASTEAADGSYNKLVQTMKALQQQWKATTDEAERAELGEQINEINNQLKELDATLGNHQRNVGNYKNDIVDALNDVQGEAKQTQMSYSEAWGQMQKSTEQTRAKFESIQKTAAGITSAYAAVQGATALLGIENSNLEQTFVKVQAAMALAQGVGGMKDLVEGVSQAKVAFGGAFTAAKTFITGLNGIKAAIVGTGIGALVVGIGLLIANWDKISKLWDNSESEERATTAVANLNTEIERQADVLEDKNLDALKQYTEDLRNAKGDVDKIREATEKYNQTLEKNELAQKRANLAAAYKAEDATYEEYKGLGRRQRKNKDNEVVKAFEEAKAKRIAIQEDIAKTEAEIENKRAKAEADALAESNKKRNENYKKQKELQEKAAEDARKAAEKAAEDARKAEEDRLKKEEHNIDRWADLERRKLDKQKEAAEQWESENSTKLDGNGDGWIESGELDKYQTFLDAKQQMYAQSIMAENAMIETQIAKLQDLANAQAEAGMDNTGTLESIEDLRHQIEDNNELIVKNEEETLKKKAKANKEYDESEKERRKLVANFTINTASNVLKSLSSIMGEESKAGKAAAIAAATIDTYQAANAAYKSMAGIPVVGPALGAAAAAAAVIAGIANVKQIMKTDASNANGSVAATNTSPNLSLDMMMPMQYTRNLQTDTEIDELNQSNKVYVVEEDITSTQQKVAVSEQSASF